MAGSGRPCEIAKRRVRLEGIGPRRGARGLWREPLRSQSARAVHVRGASGGRL